MIGIDKRAVGIYCAWWTPAIAGAILAWPWWIPAVLIVPGVVWSLATDGVHIYQTTTGGSNQTPLAVRVPFLYTLSLFVTTLPLLVATGGLPPQFSGILVACDLTLVDIRYVRFRPDKKSPTLLASRSC